MAKVISLEAAREKKMRDRQRAREALRKLLMPSKRRIVIPYNPNDPDDQKNFNRGFSAGFSGARYNPKSTGAGYACGYFGGIAARELRSTVDWASFDKTIRTSTERFDDERVVKPKRRPKLASQRVRDACMSLDMMMLTKQFDSASPIIGIIADRYGITDRTAWKVWDSGRFDFTSGGCFKPA